MALQREQLYNKHRSGLKIALRLMISILESHPDKVIPHHFSFSLSSPPLNQMSTVQLVGLQQKKKKGYECVEGGGALRDGVKFQGIPFGFSQDHKNPNPDLCKGVITFLFPCLLLLSLTFFACFNAPTRSSSFVL